jgi:hypothetical protein
LTELAITPPVCIVLTGALADDRMIDRDVLSTAESLGLAVQRADDALQSGIPLLDAVLDRIRHARVVIALAREPESPWLWLQVGAAIAFRRPVVIVITAAAVTLPPEMKDLLTVGPVLSPQALRLALQRSMKSTRHHRTRSSKPTGIPLGNASTVLLGRLASNQTELWEPSFSSWFADVLDSANVPYDRGARTNSEPLEVSEGIDFVVTANELDGNLGNPLPVELKTGDPLEILLPTRSHELASHLAATGASTLLLVARSGIDEPQLLPLTGGSLLACSARDLLEGMEGRTFGEAVIELRNRAAHGRSPQ